MTKNISEEELLLRKRARRRLIGAVFLVVLSVIVLPTFFDEPKPESKQHEIAINLPANSKSSETDNTLPPKDKVKGYETSNITNWPLDSQNKIDQHDIGENKAILDERSYIPIPGIKPKTSRKDLSDTRNTNITTLSATNAAIAATNTSKGFVIQLGAFSDQLKAKQHVESLISQGLVAYTEILKIDNVEVTRVRMGPFLARDTAESELEKLRKLGFDGVITFR